MKRLATALSTAALFCAAPAAAQDAPLAPADRADLQCIALIAVMVGLAVERGDNPESPSAELAGLSSGMMFYLGRLEGRSPGTDWLEELGRYLEKAEFEELDAVAPRCSKELTERGAALVAFGDKAPAQAE
ncbi:MAG: hypothetical protein K0M78_14250 [Brevundimonas sp.]|nr:hypothetical protein [Brevundimonas sp.]